MDYIIIVLAKLLSFISSILGGGTNLPGQFALKCRPGILKRLARGYRIILITGTNGKTTTAAMLQSILAKTGKRAIVSNSGANMKSGVASCLICNFPLFRKVKGDYAVLEVDEAYMRYITADIRPEVIAVTNIFRDQLDRYGEIDTTLRLIEEACKKAPAATLVLNADEAMFGDFVSENKRYFYGFHVPIRKDEMLNTNAEGKFCKKCKTPYQYRFITFNHLGDFVCPACGYKRPEIDLGVDCIDEISADGSRISADTISLSVPQAGAYNIYNALCAAACARVLGVPDSLIEEGIAGKSSKFGRQETVMIKGTALRIILVKNPAGAEEAIASVLPEKDPVKIAVLLNDKYADGTDVSWIYDVEFERLRKLNIKGMIAGGTRAYDMAVRLKVAGFPNITVANSYEQILEEIKKSKEKIYMLTTYTAMVSFRKFLYHKKFIKKLWD